MFSKEAQAISLSNPEAIRQFKKNRLGRPVVSDFAFRSFLSSLSKVQQTVNEGATLRAALSSVGVSPMDKLDMQKIIDQIGTETFLQSSWEDISSALSVYRDSETTAPKPVAVDPEPEQETTPPQAEELPGVPPEYRGLSEAQIAKIEEYKAKEYPKEEEYQRNIPIAFDKIIKGYQRINNPNTSESYQRMYQSSIDASFEMLDDYHEKFLAGPEETPEDQKDPEDPQVGDKEEIETSNRVKERGVKQKAPSEASPEEALAALNIESGDYISISSGILDVNKEEIDRAYQSIVEAFQNWGAQAITPSPGGKIAPPSADAIRSLNDIALGVRTFDYNIFNKYQEFIEEVDEAIEGSEDKEYTAKLISRRKYLNEQLTKKLKSALISSRLSRNDDLPLSIYNSLLYVCSFSAFKNVTFSEDKFLGSNSTFLPKDIREDSEASQVFIEALKRRTETGVINRFKKFWKLERASIDPEASRDMVSYMNISSGNFASGALSEANSFKYGGKVFRATTCPACHRVVEWHTGTRDEKTRSVFDGFYVGVFSPYIQTPDGFQFVNEDYMRYQGGDSLVLYPPPGAEYIKRTNLDKHTSQLLGEITERSLSWDEINQMVSSDDFRTQREGILRRSEAYRLVGCNYLGSKNINSMKFICPMGIYKNDGNNDACGISYNKPEGATRSYNLQPQWNGTKPELTALQNKKIIKSYKFKSFSPDWEEDYAESALSKTGGGYNFSRFIFGCPTHIEDVEDNNDYLKYGNLAFRISDTSYHPPTNGNAQPKSLDEGTISYLVCSANASLSSVDRDPNSPTYVLKFLKQLSKARPEAFVSLVDFLINQGFDDLELIQMLEDIDASETKTASILSRKNRLDILESILIKQAVNVPSDILTVLRDLTLVCPFGHKFTVGQSLKFGNSHGSIKLTNSKKFSSNRDIMESSGDDNFREFSKYLIPISEASEFKRYAEYDEWIKLPPSARKINLFRLKTSIDTSKLVFLKIKVKDDFFVFRDDVEIRQDVLWSDSDSRTIENDPITRQIKEVLDTKVRVDAEGRAVDIEDTGDIGTVSGEGEDQAEWERIMTKVLDYNLDEKDHRFSPAIPGGKKTFEREFDLAVNMGALNRSMIGALTIINTWTNSLIDDKFGESLSLQVMEDEKIRNVGQKIFDGHIANNISFEFYTEDEAEAQQARDEAMSSYRTLFDQLFVKNSELLTLIRSGRLEPEQAAVKVLNTTLADFSAKYEAIEISNDIAPDFETDVKDLVQQILNDRSLEIQEDRFNSTSLIDQITMFNPNVTQTEQGLGKLTLVAYARFLASAIHKMQTLFFAKSSVLYVGYNPLPRVFDDANDVLNVTMSEINQIPTQWSVPQIVEDPGTVFHDKQQIQEEGAKYLAFINKAYDYLNAHIKNARNLTITPRALAGAKEYVVNRLGDNFLAKYLEQNPDVDIEEAKKNVESQRARIETVFPVSNASFADIVSDFEGDNKFSPYNLLPNISVGKGAKAKADFNHPFYDRLQVEEDPENGRIILTDPDRNYNSGRIQAGVFARPTLRQWPLPKFGYHDNSAKSKNHVGIPIPLYDSGGYTGKYSELKDLGLVNMSVVANIPYAGGEDSDVNLKLDIGFLLERGYSTQHYTMIHGLRAELNEIKNAKKAEAERLSRIKAEHPAMIENLENEIGLINGKIERNRRMDNARSRNQVVILQKELEIRKKKLEELKYEFENLDTLKERLESWYQDNLSRIQTEYNSLPYSVNTQKSSVHVGDVGLSSLNSGKSFKDQKSALNAPGAKPKIAGNLHVGLTDPIMAYHLIKNNELHGQPYIDLGNNSIPEELVKDAYINFIVGVYGLDEVAKEYVKKHGKALKKKGLNPLQFTGRDLLENTIDGTLADIGAIKYQADIMPGQYYDISLPDSSMSLYAQSMVKTPDQKMPTLSKLKKMYSGLPRSAKSYGITAPYTRDDHKNAITVSSRAAKAMSAYIRKVTVGDELDPSGSEARDQMSVASDNLFEKILKRADTLSRIMIEQAGSMLDPQAILEK